MLNKIYEITDKMTNFIGVPFKLPRPTKGTLKTCSIWNFILGLGMIIVSLFSTHKWIAFLGGISIISSIILKQDSK